MKNSDLISTAEQLTALYKQSAQGRFPYDDIRNLFRKAGTSYEGLVPDLDLYFSSIAGYCSWGKRILNWDTERRQKALTYASRSFFDRHPEYKSLMPFIEQSELSKQLDNIEEMRTTLLRVLTSLEVSTSEHSE